MLDATGRPIEIGAIYGYSNRSNGVVTVTVGKATKINEKSVSLEIIHYGRAYYNSTIKHIENKRAVTSVAANSIFRLENDFVDWDND